ncbi:MAG: hypothetical protein GWP19_02550 [Planctomycetia bacterium]|nr:hypothetical protein [Planctomycetia bacterium]
MLLARYAPVGSQRFEKLTQTVKSFDKIMKWFPPQLFGIWSIFVAGIAAGKAQTDRYYFWDWSDWFIGVIGIFVISFILILLANKFKGISLQDDIVSLKSRGYHIYMPFIVFMLGFILNGKFSISSATIYILPYFAIYLIYTIEIDNSKNIISLKSKKYIKSLISIILLMMAGVIGFIIDDPIISTASIVSVPFLLVLLFGKHIRHLERAKFYPIFIFAMFVVSREAWFLIPLLLLFFILRSYNYLRYQRVYPTFGVTTNDQS